MNKLLKYVDPELILFLYLSCHSIDIMSLLKTGETTNHSCLLTYYEIVLFWLFIPNHNRIWIRKSSLSAKTLIWETNAIYKVRASMSDPFFARNSASITLYIDIKIKSNLYS